MSGNHRERDRGGDRESRSSRTQQAAAARTNEYFVPRDGIDREVITADICRYLGNDALVRPGTYENPQTRVAQQGYFINAYRNLTTEMIADLKADSARWEQERRATASRGQPHNVEYRSSTTHQSRQYYGPTEAPATAPPTQGGYPAPAGYQTPTAGQPQAMDYSPQYQGTTTYPQPQSYGTPAGGYHQDGYYVAGGNLAVDQRSDRVSYQGAAPRTNPPYTSNPPYGQSADPRHYPQAGAGQSPMSTTPGGYAQPADQFYRGTAPVAGNGYDTTSQEAYDRGYSDPRVQTYQETAPYSSQAPIQSTTNATAANSGAVRRDRERDDAPRESSSRHPRRHR